MTELGKYNYLQIVRTTPQGVYLDGENLGSVLLPKREIPQGFDVNDWIDVFIYKDSEDRPIATTRKPLAEAGQFAYLKVVDVNRNGAFLDWGLSKDLMVPYTEQFQRLKKDYSYLVYVYVDNSKRLTATTKLDKRLHSENNNKFIKGQKVEILVWRKTEMGFLAIIDNSHQGMLFNNEIFKPLKTGQRLTAYIKQIRDDDRIDLTLNLTAKKTYETLPEKILEYLKSNNGRSELTDKSSPEDIYKVFNVSKANYKKALGRLYKEKKIIINKKEISLVQ